MQDGKQGVSFDRWLMRVKDILQISMALGAIIWGGIQFLKTLEERDRTITYLQTQVSELRAQNHLRTRN